MANNEYGIDLGTNNIKIYSKNDDKILVEKNMIAIENKHTLFAYGDSAFDMYEKAPSNIHVSYPFSAFYTSEYLHKIGLAFQKYHHYN